jgi:mRNA interferase MazF
VGGGGGVAARVMRGDVRLYAFTSPDKRRPVVVLTRDRAIGQLAAVTVAPVTSTVRGVPSEVGLDESDGMKGPCAVNLYGVVTVSLDRVGAFVTHLSRVRMQEICAALRFALGCDGGAGG